MAASMCNSESGFYKSEILVEKINEATEILLKAQYSDGTLDAGGNRQSPPDTAFILEYICPAAAILKNSKQKGLDELKDKLRD